MDEIGLARSGEWGRDADDHRVAGGEVGVVGRGAQAPCQRRQDVVGDVLDVAAAFGQRLDLARVHIQPNHLMPRLREGGGEGKADVAEADDPYLHGAKPTDQHAEECSQFVLIHLNAGLALIESANMRRVRVVAAPTTSRGWGSSPTTRRCSRAPPRR